MKQYIFSKIGKIKVSFSLLLSFGFPVIILIYISRFVYLYYFTWIPILWIVYSMFSGLLYIWTTVFKITEEGFVANTALNISKTILWRNIEDIKIVNNKGNISRLELKIKGEAKLFILENTIENHQDLFETILNNVKKESLKIRDTS